MKIRNGFVSNSSSSSFIVSVKRQNSISEKDALNNVDEIFNRYFEDYDDEDKYPKGDYYYDMKEIKDKCIKLVKEGHWIFRFSDVSCGDFGDYPIAIETLEELKRIMGNIEIVYAEED